MTTTLNTAFQTLLSSVENLNLNDGDFLKMNNLLKKAYDNNTESLTQSLSLKFHFTDMIDGDYTDLCFDIYEIIRETPDKSCPRHRPVKYINYKIDYQGKTKLYSIPAGRLENALMIWILRTRPMVINVEYDGFTTEYTYKNFLENLKTEDRWGNDDEDCDYSYDYSPVMTHRLCEVFNKLFNTIVSDYYSD
jgi:hypothetical protein